MKSTFLKVTFLLLLFSAVLFDSYGQSQKYYVVIGAFAKESNAVKYSGFAHSRFFQATYELNPSRDLFYVYVIKTENKKDAYDQVRILQKEEAFSDSWVFRGTLGNSIESKKELEVAEQPEPVEQIAPTIEIVKEEIAPEETEISPPIIEPHTVIEKPVTESPKESKRIVKGKLFKFEIKTDSGEPFIGNVHHVDLLRGRDLATYKSNEESDVPRPSEQKEPMTFVCGIFGYKEVTQLIDYNDPSRTIGAIKNEQGIWTVPFVLERLKKGDVSVMYDVSFYKDAVIMLPRSQEELDELVSMMKTNPAYKIKIHGHTNGNYDRKIIAIGKSRNYFDMKGSNQKNGSAKELSKERAEAVRDYLKEHGIEKSRMEIMAWGGLNMLVNETSASSKLNDRIEIEVLAN